MLHSIKGIDVSNVINDQCTYFIIYLKLTVCPAIVYFVQTVMNLLTCSVPNCQLIHLSLGRLLWVIDPHMLLEESSINSRLLMLIESVLAKANSRRRFSNTSFRITRKILTLS